MESNSKKSKIWTKDLYKLLGIEDSATESEIKSGYRKKALKCHPDKNPDDPKAAEIFMELSSALEILIDTKAREAYDRTRKAKRVNEARIRKLDSKRRKFKEELELREQKAKDSVSTSTVDSFEKSSQETNEKLLQKEIDRLKKEGSRALIEEQELIRQQIRSRTLKEEQDRSKNQVPSDPTRPQPQGPPSTTSFQDFEAMILAQLLNAGKAQSSESG